VKIVTEHWYISPYGKAFHAYVNPFKDCATAEKLFHIIDLLLEGRLDPYMYGKLPYVVGSEKLPEGPLEEGNVHPDAMVFDAIPAKGKQLLYKDARGCYVHLRKLYPQLAPLPARKLKITEGLQEIQDYCADVASGEETKNKQQSGKAGDIKTKPETKHENKVVQENQEEVLEPKPPEFLQKILWICRYGRKHWKIILLATFILIVIYLLRKFV